MPGIWGEVGDWPRPLPPLHLPPPSAQHPQHSAFASPSIHQVFIIWRDDASPASGTTSILRSTSKYIFYDVSHSHKNTSFRRLMMLWGSSICAVPCWARHPTLRYWVHTCNCFLLQKTSPNSSTQALSDRINTENFLVCREYWSS